MFKNIYQLLFHNQSLRQTVIKNTFWLTVTNIAGRVLRAIIVIYAARVLGAEGYGVFSYAFGFAAFVMGLSDIGITGILGRNIARRTGGEEKTIATGFFIKVILSFIAYAALLIVMLYLSTIEAARPLIPIIGLSLLLDSFREFGFGVVRAFQKMEVEAFITVLSQILGVGAGLVILIAWKTPMALAVAYVITSLFTAIFVFGYLKKYFQNLRKNFDRSLVKSIIFDAWPFALITLGNTVLLYTDTLLLGWLKTGSDVGYYNVAARPIQLIGLLPNLFIVSLFPEISRRVADGTAKPIVEKGFALLMLFAFPVAIGGFLLPEIAVTAIFGDAYAPAIPVFQVLILMTLYSFPSAIFGYTLLAHNKQGRAVKYTLGPAFLNIFLNYALISRFGIIGAALATFISQAIGTLGTMRETWKLEKISIPTSLWRPLIGTAIMATVIIIMQRGAINPWVIFGSAIAIYSMALKLLREPFLNEIVAILRKGLRGQR